jgi:hypothetical protein
MSMSRTNLYATFAMIGFWLAAAMCAATMTNAVVKFAKLPFKRRNGYEMAGHPDHCDCPSCEERLVRTDWD